MAAVAADALVGDGHIRAAMGARPVPALEAVLDRFAAMVAVEIAAAGPAYLGLLHLHLDACARGDGVPVMPTGGIELERLVVEDFGVEDDLALHAAAPGNAEADIAFLDIDDQPVLVPAHCAGTDGQRVFALAGVLQPALGHHPAGAALAVERHIEAAVVERNVAAGDLVIRREDTADETDDGQPVAFVIAERIDIPPAVALRWNQSVEARSDRTASLANCPDKAAIGTPAPGWVAPPAQ